MNTLQKWLGTIAVAALALPAVASATVLVAGSDTSQLKIEAAELDGGVIEATVVMSVDLPFARSGLLSLTGLTSGVDLVSATSSDQFPGAVTVLTIGGTTFNDSPFLDFGFVGVDLKTNDRILVWRFQLPAPGPQTFGFDFGGSIDFFSSAGEGQLLADPPAHFDLTITAVPEPHSVLLLGVGLGVLVLLGTRRQRG